MVEDGGTVAKAKVALKRDYRLSEDEATDLAEVLTRQLTTRGAFYKFNLPSRKRIMDTFVMFYTRKLSHIIC